MQKLFRKYSRTLLLIFMSLLLVVFLVGDVIGRGANGPGETDIAIGTLDGKTVYLSHARQALTEFELTRSLGFPAPMVNSPNEQERAIMSLLLLHEADKHGVRVSGAQVQEMLKGAQVPPEALDRARRMTNRSLNSIYDSVGRVLATLTLFGYQAEAAAGESLPRLEQSFRNETQDAEVRLSVIDSKAFLPVMAPPSDEEIKTHFEDGKNRSDEHTEKELKFGYRIPDRVQLEYLTVDPAELQSVVRVKERDVKRYFDQNKDKYRRPATGPSPFDLNQSNPATTEMITPEFEEVKDRVKEDYRAIEALETAQRRVNEIHAEARRPWDSMPIVDGKRAAPPAESIVSFESLRAKFATDIAVTYRKTDLIDVLALRREPGLGRASFTVNRRPIPVSTLAYRVAPLNPTPDEELPTLLLNEPSPVVFDARPGPNGQMAPSQAFVFRVTQAIPAGPPSTVDEVRDKLVENLKTARAHALAGEQANLLAVRAREVGLDQAVMDAADLKKLLGADSAASSQPADVQAALKKLEPFTPERFRRQAGFIPNLGFARDLNEAVFKLIDERADASSSPARQVLVVPLANSYKWIIAEVIRVKPIYRGEFESQREQLEQRAAYPAQQRFYMSWLEPRNIVKRTGFQPRDLLGELAAQ